ncbi:MAG: hypothetical protein ACOC96_11290 [Actinomycetota bacterium]
MSERDPHDDDTTRSTAATGNRAAVDTPASGTSPEAPEADAFEQHQEVVEQDEDIPSSMPFDADPADAADQHRVVDYDEDDYR